MLQENWLSLLFLSILAAAVVNALIASCTSLYYRRTALGNLNHSELRIKQGRAQFEHRLNVFGKSLFCGFAAWPVYALGLILWLILNLVK